MATSIGNEQVVKHATEMQTAYFKRQKAANERIEKARFALTFPGLGTAIRTKLEADIKRDQNLLQSIDAALKEISAILAAPTKK